MIGWEELYAFEVILMRISGFILFSPLFGRSSIPAYARAGFILVLTAFVYGGGLPAGLEPPDTLIGLAVTLGLELAVGFVLGFVMQLCLMIVQVGGEVIDTQMGLNMAQTYDSSSQINMTVTASLLNILFFLNFFAENGLYTLVRIVLTSHGILPFGTAALGRDIADYVVALFLEGIVLAVKLAMPILAAELLGELGMGILMKAIPQINAFVISMELKVIIGLALLLLFLTPMNEFLLEAERDMLAGLQTALGVLRGG